MSSSSLTSKGQVTIPCELRQKLQLQPSDKVIFEEKDGVITITPANEDIELIASCLTNDTHHTATLEDMQQAIENGTQRLQLRLRFCRRHDQPPQHRNMHQNLDF